MSKVDLGHLRSFTAVVEAGSFNKASRLLYVAQPALSRQVAAIERTVGLKLLTRTTRGVVLTDDGVWFLAGAKTVLAAHDKFADDVAVAGGREPRADAAGLVPLAAHDSASLQAPPREPQLRAG
jgi:DNA-binding transcriptional LysR family regulator